MTAVTNDDRNWMSGIAGGRGGTPGSNLS